MRLTSLRWWLPLSYGAIAFITAVSLGLVLLLTLQRYYTWQEQRYLQNNIEAISQVVAQILESGADNLLPSQLDTFAYLTQTQIDVYDADGALLASSQDPRDLQAVATLSLQIDTGSARQSLSQTVDTTDDAQAFTSLLVLEGENGRLTSESSVSGDIGGLSTAAGFAAPLLRLETPNSYEAGNTQARSRQELQQNINGGSVRLSQGPAFGGAVLHSVAGGIVVAATVAVGMATAVGWLMSRRLSHPIGKLVAVTQQMADGDLQTRAHIARPDELRQLGDAFNDMAARIEQTIATLHQFVADAAHELNTPLTALCTNLELAARSAPANESLAQAQAQALRLQHLNDHLLHLSRLESGLDATIPEPVDLTALLADQSEQVAAQAEQAGLALNVNLPDTPLIISGSAEKISQVVENLLDNAFKFTPTEGEVYLSLWQEGEWAVLQVCDNGIGLNPAEREQLFDRFYRGQAVSAYPGSGLGLAIARQIVLAYGGQITAVPQPIGACFEVRLPLV
ncbi:MAG TPA: HAMP domain-containing sensor histidine kinase [Chloroflexota bacterium]|nr:HAMP domain-containing sensor histidine kinase [Chloroflexota bacterium]